MFATELFVREMARRQSLQSIERAREQLWSLNYNILRAPTIAESSIIGISPDIIEIVALFIDQTPLSRTREILLDVDDPEWRMASSDRPTSFIWRGEENHLRLHPPPDDVYEIWGIVQQIPTGYFPKWFNLLTGIIATETLVKQEQEVGRLKMAEYLAKWRGAFSAS